MYRIKIDKLYSMFNTTINGISEEEALKRLKSKGYNELKIKNNYTFIKIVFNQFKDFLVWLLIISAIISYVINKDEYIDCILIITVVLINASLGIIEELHAQNTLKRINTLESPEAIVKRNGKFRSINARDIVVGDIVRLEAGSLVPADIRIIDSYDLKALESPLTGEEKAVLKDEKEISETKRISEQSNMLFKGTFISSGRGIGLVLKTGNDTEIGQILKKVGETKSEKTPLEASLDKVSKTIGMIIIGVCLIVYVIELFITKDILSSFSLALSLSVAAIPEGLQSVLTTVMAISVLKMSKNKAIVKRMPVAQALGAINVIACDKTGTITTGRLELSEVYSINNRNEALMNTLNLASLDSSNQINQILYKSHEEPCYMIPFESKNKYELLIYKEGNHYKAYIKGAFDVLYSFASFKNKELYEYALELTRKKRRVLFVGTKEGTLNEVKMIQGIKLEGLVSFKDEIRQGVSEAIKNAKDLGVSPIMITGDFKETAYQIAKDVGIVSSIDEVLSHDQLEKMNDKELLDNISKYHVFARVLPLDKLRIIETYIKRNNIVAYVGDGINDTPALKKASIGISVSNALDLAKDSSDMILLDDSFSTISDAIKEGRRNFHNIRKAIRYLLSSNIGEVTVVFLVAVLSIKFKDLGVCLSPIMLLWINLVTDTLPAIALGVDNNEGTYERCELIDKKLIKTIVFEGVAIGILSLCSFLIGNKICDGSSKAMCFLTLCFSQLFFSLCLKEGKVMNRLLVASAIIGSLLTILATTLLRELFDIPPLSWLNYVIAISLAFIFVLFVKMRKFFNNRI